MFSSTILVANVLLNFLNKLFINSSKYVLNFNIITYIRHNKIYNTIKKIIFIFVK